MAIPLLCSTYSTYRKDIDVKERVRGQRELLSRDEGVFPQHRNPLHVEHQNPETSEKSRVGVYSDWRQRTAFLCIDLGMTGNHLATAKVFRPDGKHAPFGSGEH
ncbi:hypothetical protein FI667_g8861, partial [Globisporangium splendens]